MYTLTTSPKICRILPDIRGAKTPLCPTDPEGAAHEQEKAAGNHARVVPRLRGHVCLGE